MKVPQLIIFLVLFCSTIQLISTEKILFILAIASKSHKNVFDPLIEALAIKGHQVSVVAPVKSSKLHPNIKEIVPNPKNIMEILPDPFKMRKDGKISGLFFDMSDILNACHSVYNNAEFQEMTNQTFDLVIKNGFLNDCFDGIIYKMKVPHIILTTVPAPSFVTEMTGNYLPPSFVPNSFIELTDQMSFKERVLNFAMDLLWKTLGYFYFVPKVQEIYQHHLGKDLPDFYQIHHNVSLILMNSYFSLTSPRPNLPDNIEVAGMHCRPAKPLPKDLDDFLSSAEHGFIYFSLGSIVQAKNMPEETRKGFLKVFSKLKQRVIWKWEGEMTDLPPNVRIMKWLPQQDILGHKNIRLFMTHGGLLSTQETVYHGVPLLGLPVFGDQDLNMKLAEKHGYALRSEILDLDIVDLENKLFRLLNEPQFNEKAKYLSSIFRDQMQTPVERAVYWTEYVLRHKGAIHLRSAARDLNYFQVKSWDVIATLLIIIYVIIWLFVYTCKLVIRKLCLRLRKGIDLDSHSKKRN